MPQDQGWGKFWPGNLEIRALPKHHLGKLGIIHDCARSLIGTEVAACVAFVQGHEEARAMYAFLQCCQYLHSDWV